MTYLTRDQILEADDIHTEAVDVPEWGGRVLVRALTGEERDSLEASIAEMRGRVVKLKLVNVRARFVAMVCVDEEGKRLFTEADVVKLGRKSGAALDRIFDVARRLSRMRNEDVERFAENFQPGPNGGSTSS